MWNCCGGKGNDPGCEASMRHIPKEYPVGELENTWAFYPTIPTEKKADIRLAVAIDCEMGTAVSGECELIRVTVIDYFTSEVLVDRLVYPKEKMAHYNTRYSGVTRGAMEKARAAKTCFFGRDQAREAVWKFVGPNTIIIGHSLNNDLRALRWIHSNVVDTHLLWSTKIKKVDEDLMTSEDIDGGETRNNSSSQKNDLAENRKEEERVQKELNLAFHTSLSVNNEGKSARRTKGSGPHSLKTLSKTVLNREIQSNNKAGHDSLEDALASRDLAHWKICEMIYNIGTT